MNPQSQREPARFNVLVTGGTGFVGRAVVRELHRNAHRIRVLARNPHSSRAKSLATDFGVELCPGDILEPETLAEAVHGVDAVIHLVGIISEVGSSTYEHIHHQGTANLLNVSECDNVQRFVHMSALGVRPEAEARYLKSKWAAEQAVRQSGMDWTIFRPSIIYGPGDQSVNLFERMSRWLPALPVMGNGNSLFQPVPIGDVARCFVAAIGEPRAVEECLDLCGPDQLTMNELLKTMLEVKRRRRLLVHLPLPLANAQAALLEYLFGRLLRRPPPLNRDQVAMLQVDNVGNPNPANELFEISPTPFRRGLSDYLERGS